MDNWHGFETNQSVGHITAKEIACATLYLASDAAYITGEIFEVNGGSYL
jgi:NAD(P)-dependent dehydrogenase (short-subunit alcohol dehydrogenase family)